VLEGTWAKKKRPWLCLSERDGNPDFLKKFWGVALWHRHDQWHELSKEKFYSAAFDGFSFLEEFLSWVFVRDCTWAILRLFCGLKEGFCGEIKSGFLGF